MEDLIYLSDGEIDRLDIAPRRLRAALADAFRLHGEGKTFVDPKRVLTIGPGYFFQSMCAAAPGLGLAGHKWVGVAAANAEVGLATVNSLVVLSDVASGVPVAILSANQLTVMRTAAMTALAAEYLARPDSISVGFIGCGQQALGHLPALLDVRPGLHSAVCVSEGGLSAQTLAATCRDRGLDARASSDPDEALGCDVVVSSVRASGGLTPFLDATKLRPGSFAAAVDVGASWRPETLSAFDIVVTDDREQAEEPTTRARFPVSRPFDADLAELVGGRVPGRRTSRERAMFLFPGFALADLAVGSVILEAARTLRAGLALRR